MSVAFAVVFVVSFHGKCKRYPIFGAPLLFTDVYSKLATVANFPISQKKLQGVFVFLTIFD